MPNIARLTPALLALLLIGACEPEPAPTEFPSIGQQTDCRSAPRLVREGRPAATTRGDMDGDGRIDRVEVVLDPEAHAGCRALLVVRSSQGTWVTGVDRPETDLGLGLPALVGLAQIDGEPGADAVVDVIAGASTSFASVYSLATRRLAQLRVAGRGMTGEDLFAHGGSVGHLNGADCRRKAQAVVVMTSAVPRGSDYRVTSRYFVRANGGLAAAPRLTERILVPARTLSRRWPELAAPPFARCPSE